MSFAKPMEPIIINEYEIIYNSMYDTFMVSHKDIGASIAEFSWLEDAIEFCQKG